MTAAVYPSSGPAAETPGHALVLQVAIAVAAFLLIAATWAFTEVSMNTEAQEARARVEGSASNLALAVEWQLNRQLQATDQTMQNLAAEWRADPIHFDPNNWRKRSALPGDVSLQIFLLDSQGFVMSSTRPDLMGIDMSQQDYFAAQRLSRDKGLFIGPAIRWKSTGRWEINLSRRLERDDGSFAGAIVISYDPWALTSLLEQVDLGAHGLIALVGGDGSLRALVSPGDVRPGEDISRSEMFRAALQRNQSTWTGPSAPDRVVRVHAFRRLRDQDLTVVIGIERDEALRTATIWAGNALLFGGGVTVAVLLLAVLLIREVRAASGRELRLDRDRIAIERAYGELAAAKASAESKTAQIEATLAGMSDGVMVLDADLRLIQWNNRFPACTGVPPELLQVGQPMAVLLHAQAMGGEFGPIDDIEQEIRRRLSMLRHERGPIMVERQRPDGSTMELRRSRLPGGGIVTLYTDITERKRAADAQEVARVLAEEATEQKSRFVAIVSHEIRTPLNAVVNSLALLDESGLSSSQRRLADSARQAGDALLDLVNDILELSKTEASQLVVRPTSFDIRPVLEGVQAMFEAQAAARGIELVVQVAPEMPPQIRADVGRLRQVLMNLVSNAAKFSSPGRVIIQAAAVRIEGAPTLMLAVQDQGPLIPDEEAAQLFQPFSRLENARTSAAPGTGLGLAICERLTRLMGGQIGLRESADGGNEFWVTLPLQTVQVTRQQPAAPVVTLTRNRRARVLLVEDIPANHMVTATLLRREGHFVDIAESGAEAIGMVQRHPYDVAFMDLLMPGMSGYEATRRIRELPGVAGQLPIVALTANTAPEDRARCLAAGMDEMLGKPVRAHEMLALLYRLSRAPLRPMPVEAEVARLPPVESGPVLDTARLADLQQGLSAAMLVSLVDQCLDDMRGRMPKLRTALAHGTMTEIEEAAHAITGMAASYGLAAMDRRMRRIIQCSRADARMEADLAARGMEDDLAEAGEAIRDYLRAMAA
jgi:signal transduction histidine kinase/ActR/RegA family two-component response regulator/HPt (histidine-containing phosphotransfer) domain-containing protein